jgi:UDP:flavonoid glycosyltransferase YjiC (YdhE family)
VVFLALGTRGDVQPLLCVAGQLCSEADVTCVLVTHAELYACLKPHLGSVHFRPVSTSCYRRAVDSSDILAAPAYSTGRKRPSTPSLASPTTPAEKKQRSSSEHATQPTRLSDVERDQCLEACHDASLIIFNLFTLCGWHIAECLGIPCICAQPYIIPQAPPSWFEASFMTEYPLLYRALQASSARDHATAFVAPADSLPQPGSIPLHRLSWREIENWMWPLFAEDVCRWRRRHLFLPEVPFQPLRTLPPPTPLLYGISPHVLARPGYWPASVECTGFWHLPDPHSRTDASLVPPALCAFLDTQRSANTPVVYFGFGSPGSLGLLPAPRLLAEAMAHACQRLGVAVVLSVRSVCARVDGTLDWEAMQVYQRMQACGRALLVHEDLDHAWLLPQCAAIVHHGGSGTVACALRAGTPQVICPLLYDQPFWAHHMHWLGVAGPPVSLRPDAMSATRQPGLPPASLLALETALDGRDSRELSPLPGSSADQQEDQRGSCVSSSQTSASSVPQTDSSLATALHASLMHALTSATKQRCVDMALRLLTEEGTKRAAARITQMLLEAPERPVWSLAQRALSRAAIPLSLPRLGT